MPTGPLAAAAAYILWGLFPLYIRQIEHVGSLEIVLHRSLWSLVFVLGLLAVLRRFAWLRELHRQPRVLATFALTALFNVMLGYLVLHERPRPWQWGAVALAACGVLWLTVAAGQLPWVSLVLAASFGIYGLLRKTASLGAMEGLALETLLMAPLALCGLAWLGLQGSAAFGSGDTATDLWLLAAGPFTAIPLLLFAMGARRVSMATLGLLQYLGPSIQFVLAIWLYHEPFSPTRGVGFALIWLGLAVYSAESLWRYRQDQVQSAAPT